ncbi:MAG: hypothetical protein HOV80_15225 [Polyangiaceae bacterium]|nr:hypothetical protein [Polyangiaceae bacterium]
MNRISRRLWTLATAALVSTALSCGSEADAEDPSLIQGRMWVEKVPANATDRVQGIVLVPVVGRGAFSNSSRYELHVEIFEYDRDGTKLKLRFPQSDKKAEVSYSIKKCKEGQFNLCLDLDKNPWGGPKRYYAKRGGSDGEIAAREAAVVAAASVDVD